MNLPNAAHRHGFQPPKGNKYPTIAMVRCSPLGLRKHLKKSFVLDGFWGKEAKT